MDTEGRGHGTGGCQQIAPGVVSILNDGGAAGGEDSNHIALQVRCVDVCCSVVLHEQRAAGVVADAQGVAADGHLGQLTAVVDIAVGGGAVGPAGPHTVGIVGKIPRCGTVGHGCQLPAMLPGVGPGAVRFGVADVIGGDGLAVVRGQQIPPGASLLFIIT